MNTIYIPSGKAKEYGDYALNIYQGCCHSCKYCFAPLVLKKDRDNFHKNYEARENIVVETKKYLNKYLEIKNKHIHLCFTCDPYQYRKDHSITNEIIDIIHASGNFVQILTKGKIIESDVLHLCKNDIIGITISCGDETAKTIETNAFSPTERLKMLKYIKNRIKCKTFVSCEPVIESQVIFNIIAKCNFIDEYKIGKLNYAKLSTYNLPDINWKEFGIECEQLCKEYNRQYYIKESLRVEMNK